MILGATIFTVPLIKMAKQKGYMTVVCSNKESDPGLIISDLPKIVSILDRRELVKIVNNHCPKGILCAASDLATLSIGYLNDKFNLSGIKEDQVLSVTDKGEFIQLQKLLNLPMPQSISIESLTPPTKEKIRNINYPLIMKPFLSSGSRGVKKVDDYEDLCEHHLHCLNASAGRKGYVLQTFLNDYKEVGCEVFVEMGEILFIETTHKFLNSLKVPTGHCVPGPLKGIDLEDLKHQIKQICSHLGVTGSPINLDVMTREGHRPVIIDMSFRLGGNLLPEIMQQAYETSPYERVINYATEANLLLSAPKKTTDGYVGSLIFGSNKQQLFTSVLKTQIEKLFEEKANELVFDFEEQCLLPVFNQGNKRFGHALVRVHSLSEYVSLHEKLESIINID